MRAAIRGRFMGFVYQNHHLLPEFSALENVSMPLRIMGLSRRDAESESLALLNDVGLGERLHHTPGQLSGGQQQRLTIARALDLATEHIGASYLTSALAEVQLRRLYSVCLAAKLGSYRLSQHLEEVPGDGALAELPASIMREMSEAMKLEMKIEQMMNGK